MSVWDTSTAAIDLIPEKLGVHCLLEPLARRSAIRANHITGQRSAAVGGSERVKRQSQWSETAMMWWTGGQQQLLGARCVPAEALDRLWHLVSAAVWRRKPRDTAAGRSAGRPRFRRPQVWEEVTQSHLWSWRVGRSQRWTTRGSQLEAHCISFLPVWHSKGQYHGFNYC